MRDFQGHQENAYQRTGRLILLLSIAILGTIVCTGISLGYVFTVVVAGLGEEAPLGIVFLYAFGIGSVISAIIVLIGSLWKLRQIRGGGAVIARDLGGELIEPGSTDLNNRKVLNIVEEMAIAASMPIPPVYLMDGEDGINAFAAGYDPSDAVVAVTRGCVKRLTRDQLQGVIAHEFSHILNGDMRMNLRAIGVLYGVLSITICAERLIYAGIELLERPSTDNRSTLFPALVLILAGAAMWPVGLIGVFFGVLIQAAMNRQREHLADASAVEFTRNPHGIADALKVIGGYDRGSRVRNPKAVEASHLFFAQGCRLSRLLASHPPLEDRILRLDPQWDGVPIFESEETAEGYHGAFEDTMNFVGGKTQSASPNRWTGADDVVEQATETEAPWLASDRHAHGVATSMPSDLVALATESDAAGYMLLALWLSVDDHSAEADRLPSDSREPALALLPILEPLDPAQKLFLFDASVAAINESGANVQQFRAAAEKLLAGPDPSDSFRRMWKQVVHAQFHGNRPKPKFGSLDVVQRECEVLLSALVYAGDEEGMAAMYTFQRGAVHLQLADPELLIPDVCGLDQFDEALGRIAEAAPSAQRRLSLACGACVTSDREVTEEEAFLLREIYARLRFPNPGVLPGQAVTPGA